MGRSYNLTSIDQDLVVRSAQCHDLMPMMQFSVAPWRVLDAEHLKAVQKSIVIRTQFGQILLSLAIALATDGEPIINLICSFREKQSTCPLSLQFLSILSEG